MIPSMQSLTIRSYTNQVFRLFQMYNEALLNNILRLTLPTETYFNTSLLNAFFIIKQAEKYPYIHQHSNE